MDQDQKEKDWENLAKQQLIAAEKVRSVLSPEEWRITAPVLAEAYGKNTGRAFSYEEKPSSYMMSLAEFEGKLDEVGGRRVENERNANIDEDIASYFENKLQILINKNFKAINENQARRGFEKATYHAQHGHYSTPHLGIKGEYERTLEEANEYDRYAKKYSRLIEDEQAIIDDLSPKISPLINEDIPSDLKEKIVKGIKLARDRIEDIFGQEGYKYSRSAPGVDELLREMRDLESRANQTV